MGPVLGQASYRDGRQIDLARPPEAGSSDPGATYEGATPMKTYCIIWRSGGTENFTWHRSLGMTRRDADTALAAERLAGRLSSMVVAYELSLAVGLPETFEAGEILG